jgi:very-short-patch-repair endonuclease
MKKPDDRWHTKPALWERLKPEARDIRAKPTEAENLLWRYLRDAKFGKYKFRRQHSLGPFIVDFYCHQAKIIIEVDGPIHQYQVEEDGARQEYLESHGFTVLRFPNDVIINSIGKVIEQINLFLNTKKSFPLSAGGERVRE